MTQMSAVFKMIFSLEEEDDDDDDLLQSRINLLPTHKIDVEELPMLMMVLKIILLYTLGQFRGRCFYQLSFRRLTISCLHV